MFDDEIQSEGDVSAEYVYRLQGVPSRKFGGLQSLKTSMWWYIWLFSCVYSTKLTEDNGGIAVYQGLLNKIYIFEQELMAEDEAGIQQGWERYDRVWL